MTGSWARRQGEEWHALMNEARLVTVCGMTLEPPVEKRESAPSFRDAACAQCYVRATSELTEVFGQERIR